MHRVIVEKSIPYGDVSVVLAHDLAERLFVGLGLGEANRFAFIHTDEFTAQELERGEIDLFAVISERSLGLVFEATIDATRDAPS
jgi:hypothetical protein